MEGSDVGAGSLVCSLDWREGGVSRSALSPAVDDTFASWVEPHLRVLAAMAAREVGVGQADDVVQEALIRAWRRRETYRPERGSARAWLVAIVLDQSRRHRIRSLRRRPAVDLSTETAVGDVNERLVIEHAVRALPRRQRQTVTLFYLADLPVSEIARLLGISPAAVKVHLHAARDTLRTTLDET